MTTTTPARPGIRSRPLMAWGTPVFQADFDGTDEWNPRLRQMILDAEQTDPDAALFADPRAGSAGTAMPGLPWGRQFLMMPVSGAHAVVPGWLTCSLVPLEQGQHITVAVAASVP